MLVLSQNVGDQVKITAGGHSLILTVVGRHGRQIKLGFEAPRDVVVERIKTPRTTTTRDPVRK